MPNTVTSAIVRLAVEGRLEGQQVINVHHFLQDDDGASVPADIITLQNLIAEWKNQCETEYVNCMSLHYTLTKLSARSIVAPVVQSDYEYSVPVVGTVYSDAEATQVASVITWRTAYAGRRARGRTYMPALPKSAVDNGLINAAHIAKMDAYGNAVIQLLPSAGFSTQFDMVILSDPSHLLPDSTIGIGTVVSPSWDAVTTHVSRNIPGTIRKRRIGVGS